MDIIKKILKYVGKFLFAIVLTPIILISFNYLTKDSLIKIIADLQGSSSYKEYFKMANPCDISVKNTDDNGVLIISEFLFKEALGSCYVGKLEATKLVVIDKNYGGRKTSAILLADEIEKNNVNVIVVEECYSACVDVLMHGNKRLVCENALVGIHQQSSPIEYEWVVNYLKKNNKYAMEPYKEKGINVDLVLEILENTPHDEMYELTSDELLKTGIATEIISCTNDNL